MQQKTPELCDPADHKTSNWVDFAESSQDLTRGCVRFSRPHTL